MPYEQSTRLEADLQLVEDFAATASDDDKLPLAETMATMRANLQKARRCEDGVLSIADLNAMLQAEADSLGVPFAPLPVPPSTEVATLRQHLEHCRALLLTAFADGSVKEIRRIASVLIRTEKNLWHAMNDSKELVDHDFCKRAGRAFLESIDKSDAESWARRVDAHLAAVEFQLTPPKHKK
jgi:hypothetical protein